MLKSKLLLFVFFAFFSSGNIFCRIPFLPRDQMVKICSARIACLSNSEVVQNCKDELEAFVPDEKQVSLLEHMSHFVLSNHYMNSELFKNSSPELQSFMQSWMKNHEEIKDWKKYDIQETMNDMVKSKQTEKAWMIMDFCRVQMAVKHVSLVNFAKKFAGHEMPMGLAEVTCRSIDNMSYGWLQCARPLPQTDPAVIAIHNDKIAKAIKTLFDKEVEAGFKIQKENEKNK